MVRFTYIASYNMNRIFRSQNVRWPVVATFRVKIIISGPEIINFYARTGPECDGCNADSSINSISKYNRTVPAHILHTGATVHLWRATVHPRATVHSWVKVHLVSKFSTL